MLNFMKKIPAGIVLIPMFLSALFYTFFPDLFKIGGFTESIFTNQSLNFILGVACFVSGICLDLSIIGKILKKQGILVILKVIISVVFAMIFVKLFGTKGILGVSSLAFIIAICSSNPSIYLPIAESLGTKEDELAFGVVSLVAIPAIPLFVYGLTSTNIPIDYMPIISTLIPIILGIIWGNLDKDARSYFSPLLSGILPFLGWAIGSNIRLDQAFKAGFSGFILLILFYLVSVPLLVIFERTFLKGDGVSSVALNSVSGLSVSLPAFICKIIPDAAVYQDYATAQLTLCLILTSILTPMFAKMVYNYKK